MSCVGGRTLTLGNQPCDRGLPGLSGVRCGQHLILQGRAGQAHSYVKVWCVDVICVDFQFVCSCHVLVWELCVGGGSLQILCRRFAMFIRSCGLMWCVVLLRLSSFVFVRRVFIVFWLLRLRLSVFLLVYVCACGVSCVSFRTLLRRVIRTD